MKSTGGVTDWPLTARCLRACAKYEGPVAERRDRADSAQAESGCPARRAGNALAGKRKSAGFQSLRRLTGPLPLGTGSGGGKSMLIGLFFGRRAVTPERWGRVHFMNSMGSVARHARRWRKLDATARQAVRPWYVRGAGERPRSRQPRKLASPLARSRFLVAMNSRSNGNCRCALILSAPVRSTLFPAGRDRRWQRPTGILTTLYADRKNQPALFLPSWRC